MEEFFISDEHFNHTRMSSMRGFSSYTEMNEALISAHNSVVSEKDNVFCNGDFSFRDDPCLFLDRLNGHFYFIRGNHDQKRINHKKIVHWVDGYYDVKLHGQKITLCHFPMLSWECSHYGAWMLHGHHHSSFTGTGKMLNVSVEGLTQYTGLGVPISFDQVMEIMKGKPDNWDLIKKGVETDH